MGLRDKERKKTEGDGREESNVEMNSAGISSREAKKNRSSEMTKKIYIYIYKRNKTRTNRTNEEKTAGLLDVVLEP